jgi:hypothetical protein
MSLSFFAITHAEAQKQGEKKTSFIPKKKEPKTK